MDLPIPSAAAGCTHGRSCLACGVRSDRAAQAGLLLSVTADRVIRLVPALTLTRAEADEIVALLPPLLQAILAE